MSSVDHGQENEPAVAPAEQIAVDGSVGSDTDTGAPNKQDSVTAHGLDYQHHARSNSVKKPTTFKAVSVTKNFLAKAGTPPTPNSKSNSENLPATVNGAGAGALGPRPRLVAKSSGTQQAKGHFAAKNGAGPDPMQVWNRNRAAAPQHPPKHLTDEELKQQYGIHLATRIQADGDGKEAKWADIDDEDDWAPDTIEWNDGTKIDLSKQDSAALLAEQRAAEEAAKRREEEEKKAKAAKAAAEKKPTTSVGPNATVLKPRSSQQAKPGTPLVLKTPTEKPTLVSKPSSNAPAKSPWAPLPTIDKVPPIEINPPLAQNASRPQPNGIQPSPIIDTPSQPALEIAADSFKRGGSESQKDTIGQLYNDKSGKYEPAAAGRRGSVRKEGNFRAPSLLQRGGPGADASAILENNRVRHDDGEFEIRRKSSGVSGDSGSHARTFSDRRGSQHSQAIQSPSLASAHPSVESPSMEARVPGAYRAGPGSGAAGAVTDRDDVALQKQMMKEKRELAIKRRKEQEEREQAEKMERIRKKLETLGPAPEPEKREAVQAVTIERRPAEPSADQAEKLQSARSQQEPAQNDARPAAASPVKAMKSPPKPPVPSASGEPLQYGMMKVHALGPRDPLQQVHDTLTAEKSKLQSGTSKTSRNLFDAQPEITRASEGGLEKPTGQNVPSEESARPTFDPRERINAELLRQSQNQRQMPPGFENRPKEEMEQISPLLNGSLTPNKADHLFSRSPELTNHRSAAEARQQPWNDGSRDPRLYAGFNSQQFGRDAGSVWGASNQSRGGLFDRTVQRPTSRHQDQYASPALAPIGPPKQVQQAKDARENRSIQSASPAAVFEDSQTVPSYPSGDQFTNDRRDRAGRLVNGESKFPTSNLATGAQFEQQRNDNRTQLHTRDSGMGLAGWKDFSDNQSHRDAEEARRYHLERQALKAEEARTGLVQTSHVQYNEKWSQVKVPDRGLGRDVVGVERHLQAPSETGNTLPSSEMRGPSFVHPTDLPSTLPGGLGRGSRFFPTAGRFTAYQQPVAPFSPFYRRGDSPPPPDDMLHPVLSDVDTRRVVVKLPWMDETPYLNEVDTTPKVKLPPSLGTPTSSPRPAAAEALSLRPVPQGLVNNPSWQERFNSMLGNRKISMERSPDRGERRISQMVDFSATKEPLDLPSPEETAAVTLPPRGRKSHARLASTAMHITAHSRSFSEEEALLEPEAGSMPAVRFPASLGHRPWSDKSLRRTPAPKSLPPASEVDAASQDVLTLPSTFDSTNTLLLVFVNLKGMFSSKSKSMRPPPGISPPVKEPAPAAAAPPRHPQANANANAQMNSAAPPKQPFQHKPRQQSAGYAKHREANAHAHQKNGNLGNAGAHAGSKRGAGTGPRSAFRHGSGHQQGPTTPQQHAVAT